MAMTVTATMSGTPANEHIYLWIRVLTNATETGGASVASLNAAGGTGVTASLTPNFSNSVPFWAVSADNWGGSFTAAASNTVDSTNVDPDTWGGGFGRYTGTVTAATPLTFGVSGVGGGCDYSTWAAYEIPASGGTVTIDGSSPVVAAATGAGVKTVTSASFTPPAGSVIVASVVGGGTGTLGTFTITVTDTGGGLTWTKRASNTSAADQNTAIFTATVGGGGGGSSAPMQVQPGSKQFRRRHRRAQTPFPQPSLPTQGAATLAGAGSLSTAGTVSPGATLAGTGVVAASTSPPSITGLGGTGAGYFIDSNGNPRFVLGDAVWGLPGNAGRWNSGNWQGDYDTYLGNRATQGFTVVYAKPMGTTQNAGINDDGRTFDSLFPFQGGTPSTGVSLANPSSGLTSAFWARIDYFLNSALAKGITIFFNAIGYASDFDSGPGPLAGKSTTEFTAFGTALGGRYKNQPNLVWHLADDYFGDNDSLITAFMTGVRGAGDSHAVSIENMPESTSRKTLDTVQVTTTWGAANAQYNFCYSYNVTYYGVEKAYLESSPIPVIQGDGYFYQGNSSYEGGTGAFAFDRAIRQDAWHAISSGARGIIHGSESTWQYASTALAASGTDWYYANNAGVIRAVMESLAGWHTLVPDTSSALITAGRGTPASAFTSGGGGGQYEVAFTDTYVTASRTPDTGAGSTLAVIYMSHATTITVDQTKMVSGYTATWVDPITGATSSATAGSTYNSTAKGNNSKGEADWVLVLQGSAAIAGAATLAGAGSLTAGATSPGAATLAGTGSLTAKASESAAATLAGAGSLTAGASLSAGASLPGAGSLTNTSAQTAGASLAGAGAIGTPTVQQGGKDTLGGAGALTTAATVTSGASLGGTGTIGTPAVVQGAGATLAGTGSIAGSGSVTSGAGAALAGTGSLTSAAVQGAAATLAGTGSLSTASAQSAGATLGGAGSIGTPASQQGSKDTLGGAGSLATAAVQGAGATLAGTGALSAASTASAPATLNGTGTITGQATAAGAVLGGAGSLAAGGSLSSPATLAGTGSITGSASAAGATLAGAGSLTTAAVQGAGTSLAGTGSITGTGTPGSAAGATLAGTGSIIALSAVSAPATLAGTGTITGSAATAGATLTGAGSLSTAAVLSAAVTLAGTGSLTGSGSVASGGATATLAGTGSLTTTSAQSAGATLAAAGSITTAGVQGAKVTLTGTGSITGSGVPAIPGGAALAGTGSITALAAPQAAVILAGSGSITTRGAIGPAVTLTGTGTLLGGTAIRGGALLLAAGSITALGISQAPVQPGHSTNTTISQPMQGEADVTRIATSRATVS